ncbi:MAG TPA: TIM barrel protein [Dongiaceae bacterium]|nr:TIM barrel protein [Dongiaceae bacterium]
MKLGIGTYTYMWSIGFPGASPEKPMLALDLLAKATELGVHVVQYGPNLPLDALSQGELELLVERARTSNIEIEIGTRGLETDHLREQIHLGKRVGACLLRTVPELSGETPPIGQIESALQRILPDLEESGVRLALENGKVPAERLAEVLATVDSRWVGVTLDTANSLAIPEGTREVVRHLAKHTFCFHVKDFVVKRVWHMMGFSVEGCPADMGQMELPWILQELRSAGADPNAILELWPPERSHLNETIALEDTWARKSIANLRRYIPN